MIVQPAAEEEVDDTSATNQCVECEPSVLEIGGADEGAGHTLVQKGLPKRLEAVKVPPKNRKLEHNLCTHFPKDRNCVICMHAKTTAEPKYSKKWPEQVWPGKMQPKEFGTMFTLDHIELDLSEEGRNDEHKVLSILDIATIFMMVYPSVSSDADTVEASLCYMR